MSWSDHMAEQRERRIQALAGYLALELDIVGFGEGIRMEPEGEDSRGELEEARAIAQERFAGIPEGELRNEVIERCKLDAEARHDAESIREDEARMRFNFEHDACFGTRWAP